MVVMNLIQFLLLCRDLGICETFRDTTSKGAKQTGFRFRKVNDEEVNKQVLNYNSIHLLSQILRKDDDVMFLREGDDGTFTFYLKGTWD